MLIYDESISGCKLDYTVIVANILKNSNQLDHETTEDQTAGNDETYMSSVYLK